jgi:hypothetical protein
VLLTRADELEALLRLSFGDSRAPAKLASGLPPARSSVLHARIALASSDHRAAVEHLHSLPSGDLTPRRALVRQVLLAAAAIERGDPAAAGIAGRAVQISNPRARSTEPMTPDTVGRQQPCCVNLLRPQTQGHPLGDDAGNLKREMQRLEPKA